MAAELICNVASRVANFAQLKLFTVILKRKKRMFPIVKSSLLFAAAIASQIHWKFIFQTPHWNRCILTIVTLNQKVHQVVQHVVQISHLNWITQTSKLQKLHLSCTTPRAWFCKVHWRWSGASGFLTMLSMTLSTFGHWGFSMKYKSDIILSYACKKYEWSITFQTVCCISKKKPPSMTATISNDIMFSLNCLFSINKVRKAYAELFALVIPEQSQPEHGDIMVAQSTAICSILKL